MVERNGATSYEQRMRSPWLEEVMGDMGVEYDQEVSDVYSVVANKGELEAGIIEGKRVVLIVSGVSGGGKDSVIRELPENKFSRVISATTRERRVKLDKDGREIPEQSEGENEYVYLDGKDEKGQKRKAGNFKRQETRKDIDVFVETASYGGEWYGTLRGQVRKKLRDETKIPVFRVDPKGMKTLNELKRNGEVLFQSCVFVNIFLVPESEEVTRKRLVDRGENADTVDRRMREFRTDLEGIDHANYIFVNRTGQIVEVAERVKTQALWLKDEVRTRSIAHTDQAEKMIA